MSKASSSTRLLVLASRPETIKVRLFSLRGGLQKKKQLIVPVKKNRTCASEIENESAICLPKIRKIQESSKQLMRICTCFEILDVGGGVLVPLEMPCFLFNYLGFR